MPMNVYVRVALFCGLFAMQCSVTVLSSVTRDTVFLRVYDSRYISHMVLLMSFATAYASTAISQLQQRGVHASSIAYAFPCMSSAFMMLFWALLVYAPSLVYITSILVYTWVEISGQLLAQQFWDICSAAFNVSESKQYFGAITFGSTIGTLCASFGLIPLMRATEVSTEGTLVVVALLQATIGLSMVTITPLFQVTSKPSKPTAGAPTSVLSEIQRRSYLKHVCFFEFGATVARVFIDYSTLAILGQYPEATVKDALGSINGVQSFLMMPLQVMAGPLFTYFGVMYGISTLPLAVLVFGITTYLSSSSVGLIGSRATYNSVSYAIFNPARELLWLPLHAQDRSKFKSFVTGPFRSLARIVGALFSMTLTSDFVTNYCSGSSAVSVAVIVLGIVWFGDALAARQAYAAEFYASLKKGHMDVTSHLIDFTTDQVDLVQSTLRRGESNRIAFVLGFICPPHVPMFHTDLRNVFYRPDMTLPTKLKLLQLHVAYTKEKHHDESACIFHVDDLLALYHDTTLPRQLRLAAVLACGYSSDQALERLHECLDTEIDVSLRVGVAISVLRASQWMDERATILLQKLLHEPPDVKAKVICLRIVGRELPELLGNGYLVYLLHQSQESRIVHAALECCRQSKRTSAMLVPALVKWLADASFRAEALDALSTFPPSIVWENIVDYLEKALEAHNFEAALGGVRCLEMGQFPPHAKVDAVLNMMDALMDMEGLNNVPVEMDLSHVLVLSQRLPLWELLADAIIRVSAESHNDQLAMLSRVDRIVAAYVFQAYQLHHLRQLFADDTHAVLGGGLLAQVLECALDNLLRVVLKFVSSKFPQGFNVHVLIEGLHSDVPEVLSAVQEVLETLLQSPFKHTLTPLLFPQSPKAPAALQIRKHVQSLQVRSALDHVMESMTDPAVDMELSCLAMEHYLGLATTFAVEDTVVLPESQAHRLIQHPIAKEAVVRTLSHAMTTDRAKTLRRMFQAIALPTATSAPPTVTPLAYFDVVTSLRACALFRSINVIELVQKIATHFSQVVVAAGAVIVAEGDAAMHMYVIASGSVQLHQHNDAVLATLHAGACVGELALLMSKGTHPTSATALTDCVLLSISQTSFKTLIQTSTAIARGVLDALASALKWTYFQATNSTDNRRLKRLVSQVTVTANVDKAATAMLSKIGRQRHRSKSEVPSTEAQKVMATSTAPKKELLVRSQSKSHLREYSSLQLNSSDFDATSTHALDTFTMTRLEKCLHLKASAFMKDMDDDQIAAVAQMAQVVVLPNGATLYHDGAPASSMFVVVEGSVVCATNSPQDGDGTLKETFEPGDSFGELSFSRGATHISTATAVSMHLSVVLLEIPAVEFIELAEKHIKLLHLVLAWLSRTITIKMNIPQDFHLPLTTSQPLSPIGSPRSSPRRHSPPRKMWSDGVASENGRDWSGGATALRQRQNTI
ncbi:hypothetical protein H310_06625 [Aphanomyces invadans]|uniref:Cyclic nucleotide-binding domain-containing protein n=1 Tax=Aphanomyces invadans TaxID=157072 RepID=A0A024U528_9STRA|nr:hypothetical protein H310_06625 [Aphanomyces invadans]ETW00982.1 hypothetical protein H310_06625 [Aphanomyces invadans]|eukprot:XP_008869980.1 hypothetical protein H310_06625 [Aphanomyces invadans]